MAVITWCKSNLFRCDRRLDPGCNGIDSCAHPAIVESLVLLANGVLCVDSSALHVALLYRLATVKDQKSLIK